MQEAEFRFNLNNAYKVKIPSQKLKNQIFIATLQKMPPNMV